MKQTIKCLLCCLCAAMFTCVSAFAQVTTSALGGRVVDAKGEPVVGAAVVEPFTALSPMVRDVTPSTVCVQAVLTPWRFRVWDISP